MTANINLTNPRSVTETSASNARNAQKLVHYRERVVEQLITQMSVPLRVAEVLSIDKQFDIGACQRNGLTPQQTAKLLYDVACTLYTTNDQWHFQQRMPTDEELEQQKDTLTVSDLE